MRGDQLNRREAFLASIAVGGGGLSRVAFAQAARKIHNIGILGFSGTGSGPTGAQPADRSTAAFLDGMRALGYRYGEHFVTESRGPGGDPERLPALAAELVRQQPDVIIAGGGLPAVALKQATTTIPIVMAASVDPVGQGLVQSLARPGGNVTGMSLQSTETIGKRLELLKELVPGCDLRRQDSEGRQTRRPAGGTADQVRVGDQYEDRPRAGHLDPAGFAAAGG